MSYLTSFKFFQRTLAVISREAKKVIGWKTVIACTLSALTGVIIIGITKFSEIVLFFKSVKPDDIGTFFIVAPVFVLLILIQSSLIKTDPNHNRRGEDSDDFLSVDRRSANRRNKESNSPNEILAIIRKESRHESFNYDKIREIIEQTISQEKNRSSDTSTFTPL